MRVFLGAAIVTALSYGCTGTVAPVGDPSGSGSAPGHSGTGGGTTPPVGVGSGGTMGGNPPVGSGGTPGVITPGSGGAQVVPMTPPPPGTDPGRVTLHRLNRVEYNNTVRDLLGTTRAPADEFPIDDRGMGFDNVADVLTLSPLHIDNYRTAAMALIDEAMTVAAQRAKIVTCNLATMGATCARTALTAFAPLAWRRPVTTAEIDALMGPVTLATTQGDTAEVGFKLALQAILVSPHFIFRVETDPAPTSLAPHPLNGHEIASRLSYFLWSSMPDADLFTAARAGTLNQSATVQAQVTRMLASPKAQALVDNFAGQWLYTRQIAEADPDPKLFPMFDASLRSAMKLEMEALFKEVVLNGLPADKLLTADFTFVNDRLARHYGLPGVTSTTPVKVSLAGNTQRGGILSHGGFLAVTSHPDKTSPVVRGKWVMSQLLCVNVAPPPANVNAMFDPSNQAGTLRQQLEKHRTDPSCAVCHKMMDPIGLGLENYDAVGVYRTMDANAAIDASGQLPDGRTFNGRQDLASLIAADPNYPRCVTEQLYTYALGRVPDRTPGHMDPATLYGLAESFRTGGFKFKELLAQIAVSPTFLNRRGEP